MKIRTFLFLLLMSLSSLTRADVFIVNSNSDSGIGTLREAIGLAALNGTAAKDFIHFDIDGNSPTKRTITLLSELPFLSSNLVIITSTQPGSFLGTSQAKIMIKADRFAYMASDYNLGCFNIRDASDIQIFGFAFDGFYNLKVKTNPSGQATEGSGISIISSSRIVIGAPNVGNVFMENGYAIYSVNNPQYQSRNRDFTIQSNWFGLDTNGVEAGNRRNGHLNLITDNCEFGGPDSTYGNILGGYSASGFVIGGDNCNIKFNKFGFNSDGSVQDRMVALTIRTTNSFVTDNIGSRLRITLEYCRNIKIFRNKEVKADLLTQVSGVSVYYSQNIQIGDENLANANIFLPVDRPLYNHSSNNVEVRKNIIHCNNYTYVINAPVITTINVLVNSDTEYSGIATPNSEVYIYNDYTDCKTCSPLQFYEQTIANANGEWKITGNFSDKKFIANATLVKSSSEFTQPQILPGSSGYWYNKLDPSCGQNNGSLELTRTLHLLKVEWYNLNNVKVGEGNKIENLPPGRYYAKGFNGKCFTQTVLVDLINIEPTFVASNLRITQPGCGSNNGAIQGLYYNAFNQFSFKWINDQGVTISSTNLNLSNIGPGKYTLVVSNAEGCSKSYGPILLQNTDGPNLDRTNANIIDANCGTNDGSIKGLIVSGAGVLKYIWTDEDGRTISQTADLLNVPFGKYTLAISDESACNALINTFDVGEKNGIAIDITNRILVKSTCINNNGSISGITVSGATSYKWFNEQQIQVSDQLLLKNIPAGKYYLVAYNSTCDKKSMLIAIDQQSNLINIGGFDKKITNSTCGNNNGSVEVILQNPIVLPKAYRWENENGETISNNTLILTNVAPGLYKLYGIDDNNCEILLISYNIDSVPIIQINNTSLKITSDRCSTSEGTITGVLISGGIKPYAYKWTSANGEVVGNELNLLAVKMGSYKLEVTDASGCTLTEYDYFVNNTNETLLSPKVQNITLCASGIGEFKIDNPLSGYNYFLYEDSNSQNVIGVFTNGILKMKVSESRSYFVSQNFGSCESERAELKVIIGFTELNISNAITPNNDQVNDVWQIKSIENYPKALVQIFNRMGVKVFESIGYKNPFHGNRNGKPLPIGVYYYLINFGSECSSLKGSLTLIR